MVVERISAHRWADTDIALASIVARDPEAAQRVVEARSSGDLSAAPLYAGESVGLVTAERPAADRSNPWRDENGDLPCDPSQVPPGR